MVLLIAEKTYIFAEYAELLNFEILYLFLTFLEECKCEQIFDIYLEKGIVRFYFSFLDLNDKSYLTFILCKLEKFLNFGEKYKKDELNLFVESFI